MLTLLLTNPALALNCDDLEPQLCNAVEQMAVVVPQLADAAPVRLRPATVYGQLDQLQQATVAGGCQAQARFDGWSAGTYGPDDRFRGEGSDGTAVDGRFRDPATTRGLPDRLRDRPRSVVGGWTDGDGERVLGSRFGGYSASGRILANVDQAHLAGHWIRLQGRRGVFVALSTTCDGAVAAPDALAPWYGEPLAMDVRDLQIAFDFDAVDGLTSVVTVAAEDAADLGSIALRVAGEGGPYYETVTLNHGDIRWSYSLPVPPSVPVGVPPTLEVTLTEFDGSGAGLGAPVTCGLVATEGSSCTVERGGFERVITWTNGGVEVDGDGTSEGDVGSVKVFVQGGGGSIQRTAPPGRRWTQVVITHAEISAACSGQGWDCAPPWSFEADVRGTDGYPTGSTGGLMERVEQFGEILIDGVIWEVE